MNNQSTVLLTSLLGFCIIASSVDGSDINGDPTNINFFTPDEFEQAKELAKRTDRLMLVTFITGLIEKDADAEIGAKQPTKGRW